METFLEVLACAKDLPLTEQRELVRLLKENIKYLEKVEYVETAGFCIGDKVTFDLHPKNDVTIVIKSFSRDGMGIQGFDASGTFYIVSASQCRKA